MVKDTFSVFKQRVEATNNPQKLIEEAVVITLVMRNVLTNEKKFAEAEALALRFVIICTKLQSLQGKGDTE